MSNNKWTINGYVGPKLSGKTYLALKEAQSFPRQLRFNRNEDNPLLKTGAQVIRDKAQLFAAINDHKSPFKICWEGHVKYGVRTATDILVKVALRARNCHLLLDESQDYMPRDISTEKHYNDLFTKNRHPNISVAASWTSFTPKTMSPTVRNNTDETAIFYCSDELYQDYLKRNAKGELEKLRKAMNDDARQYSHIKIDNRKEPKFIDVRV